MAKTFEFRVSVVSGGSTIDYGVHTGTRAQAMGLCEEVLKYHRYGSIAHAWIVSPLMTPVEPWVTAGPSMPPADSPLLVCRVCGSKMEGPMLDLALRDLAQGVCSPVCREREVIAQFACCEKAVPKACVCAYAFDCPTHGERHVGSHD